jgi:HD domain
MQTTEDERHSSSHGHRVSETPRSCRMELARSRRHWLDGPAWLSSLRCDHTSETWSCSSGTALDGPDLMVVCSDFPFVDRLLGQYTAVLGRDFAAYRNHVTRVLNYFFAIAPELRDVQEQVLVAAAFHDLGIWTDRTFDYLGPSKRLALEYLESNGLTYLAPEVAAIIQHHHKIRPYAGPYSSTVEPFRRADLVDLSLGLIGSGIGAHFVHAVKAAYPNAGFHARLTKLSARQLIRSPLHPLPMVHW